MAWTKGGYKLRVRLCGTDPHPHNGSRVIAMWWGREITVGRPRLAKRSHNCGTMYIYPILGPPEFVAFLIKNKCGLFVCEHQMEELKLEDFKAGYSEHRDSQKASDRRYGKRDRTAVRNLNLADLAESQENAHEV